LAGHIAADRQGAAEADGDLVSAGVKYKLQMKEQEPRKRG
jgi:hypothetical protein